MSLVGADEVHLDLNHVSWVSRGHFSGAVPEPPGSEILSGGRGSG